MLAMTKNYKKSTRKKNSSSDGRSFDNFPIAWWSDSSLGLGLLATGSRVCKSQIRKRLIIRNQLSNWAYTKKWQLCSIRSTNKTKNMDVDWTALVERNSIFA